MELRYNELDRARNIYERYVQCIPSVKAWVRYAKFEMKNGQIGLARRCYERAVGEMGEDAQTVSAISLDMPVSQCHSYRLCRSMKEASELLLVIVDLIGFLCSLHGHFECRKSSMP